jgi:hypothetical protein
MKLTGATHSFKKIDPMSVAMGLFFFGAALGTAKFGASFLLHGMGFRGTVYLVRKKSK